jgi:hypothetical protein
MWSERPIACDLKIFKEVEVSATNEEKELLKKNYHVKNRDGTLEFEKPHWIITEEKEKFKADLKEKAKNGKITNNDIADFIQAYL